MVKKMRKINVNVPDGKSGDWAVESFKVEKNEFSQMVSIFKTGRGVPEGEYKRLMRNGCCIMSNTPDEIRDFMHFVHEAKGSVLINGLGLGVVLQALLDREDDEITDITVIEKSPDVINLVAPTFANESRVRIINADAFEYIPEKGKKFGAIWHDIWDNICSDNLEEMTKLHRKYGKKTDYQDSWCKGECIRAKKRDSRGGYY